MVYYYVYEYHHEHHNLLDVLSLITNHIEISHKKKKKSTDGGKKCFVFYVYDQIQKESVSDLLFQMFLKRLRASCNLLV